jgi:hypothetical protein
LKSTKKFVLILLNFILKIGILVLQVFFIKIVRGILEGIVHHMLVDDKSSIGSIQYSDEERKKLA